MWHLDLFDVVAFDHPAFASHDVAQMPNGDGIVRAEVSSYFVSKEVVNFTLSLKFSSEVFGRDLNLLDRV